MRRAGARRHSHTDRNIGKPGARRAAARHLRARRRHPDPADRLRWTIRDHASAEACALHPRLAANIRCGGAPRRAGLLHAIRRHRRCLAIGVLSEPATGIMTMRKLLGLIVLVLVAVVAIAQFGPSALLGEETTGQDSRPVPEFSGISDWINSPPLTAEGLRGKVVLVQFWTYSCINWLRTTPYVRAWAEKYRDKGLVVIGVHSPEFDFEKQLPNVRWGAKNYQVDYPIAVDSDF